MKWFKGILLKEIYWREKSYRQGDAIRVSEEDMRTLTQAGVIGNVRSIDIEKEYAVSDAPETAMKRHGTRKKNA